MQLSRALVGLKTAFVDVPARAVKNTASFAFGQPAIGPDSKAGSLAFGYVNVATDVAGAFAALVAPALPLFVFPKIVTGVLSGLVGIDGDRSLLRSAARGGVTAVAMGAGAIAAYSLDLPMAWAALAGVPAAIADLRDLAVAFAPPEKAVEPKLVPVDPTPVPLAE